MEPTERSEKNTTWNNKSVHLKNEILSFFPQLLSATWQRFGFWAEVINLAL